MHLMNMLDQCQFYSTVRQKKTKMRGEATMECLPFSQHNEWYFRGTPPYTLKCTTLQRSVPANLYKSVICTCHCLV